MPSRYDAVIFDLLTGLIDSWTLWNDAAGNAEDGGRWRHAYLQLTYATGDYQPYEDLVRQAAAESGAGEAAAERLISGWANLRPWPEARPVLDGLKKSLPLAVVTNCSDRLGHIAADTVGVPFDCVVTAERAGAYKPDPRPYRLALEELGVAPERALFVAGSAFDVGGAGAIGMPVYWHNHVGLAAHGDTSALFAEHRSLEPLRDIALARDRD